MNQRFLWENIMKKSLVVIISVALGAFLIQPAAAENCQFHKMQLLNDTFVIFEEPLPGFDWCGRGRVLGTINGYTTSCLKWDDIKFSDDIWGDSDYRFVAVKFFNVFETNLGTFQADERAFLDLDSGSSNIAATMSEVTGGTGAYEGATGLLTMESTWPNEAKGQLYQGDICTP